MRILVLLAALALLACHPPSSPPAPPADASAGSTGARRVAAPPIVLEPRALAGLWSFDRNCGNYDLVFDAEGSAQHYAVSESGWTTSYAGTWQIGEDNRVILELRVLDEQGRPAGNVLIYNLDIAAPVGEEIAGDFGAEGQPATPITALRCPDEDRD